MDGNRPDYEAIEHTIRHDGWVGVEKASADKGQPVTEVIPSLNELKRTFFEDWITPDEKSGLTYEQKIATFFEHIRDEEKDPDWQTIGAEVPFHFEVRPGIFLRGFIDKIQCNDQNELRIVDYKTSKAVYDQKKLATPLQLYIYHLACKELYPDYKIKEYMYDFVLLGETVLGGTKGWLARADKKLNKLLDQIAECESTGIWAPKPSPLCYWCSYSCNNPHSQPEYRNLCPYYSLWTPEDRKNFGVNLQWFPDEPDELNKTLETHKAVQEFRW